MATNGPHHPQLGQLCKPNLQVMGVTHALFKGLEDNLPSDTIRPGTPLRPDEHSDAILTAQAQFCEALLRLHSKQLIKPSTTMTLLRNFHNNVPVHRIRATRTSDTVAQRWDALLHTTVCAILNTPSTPTLTKLTHLPTDLGGLGIHDLNLRRHVAFYAAWRQTAYHASEELSATTEQAWKDNNATTSTLLLNTAQALQPLAETPLEVDWTDWIATPPDKHTEANPVRRLLRLPHTATQQPHP